jgi:hypothetical protein
LPRSNFRESTVRRQARFARDLDLIATELGEDFRRAVLTGQARLSRREIHRLADMSRSEKERYLARQEEEKEKDRAARRKPRVPAAPMDEPRDDRNAESPIRDLEPLPDERSACSAQPLASPASPERQPLAVQDAGTSQAAVYDPDTGAPNPATRTRWGRPCLPPSTRPWTRICWAG